MGKLERLIRTRGGAFRLRVETSSESADYAKYEALRDEIWGFPEDNLPGS